MRQIGAYIQILLVTSIIYGQFQTSNANYRGFSKIDCLGLIIYGIDDENLFDEIEKLTRSIATETLPRNVILDYFTECPLYPLSVEFHTIENKDGTVSGTIAVAVEATSESTPARAGASSDASSRSSLPATAAAATPPHGIRPRRGVCRLES